EESVVANGTSTFALFPGSLASMWGYRREIEETRHWLRYLLVPSILGGVMGSFFTLLSPAVFRQLVPWLILTASLLFLLQPTIARWMGVGQPHAAPKSGTLIGLMLM